MTKPKLFVSYSWTSPDHEAWVLRLATDLRESGIDVILDKWDLKEGHDAHAFMEKMVSDPTIRKVILVCDKAYVDKTDERSGGVGTEAQIISGEIYEKQEQDKFVAIVTEYDDGKACLPAYYRSRIYIDMRGPSAFSESFDQLLRWAHDQPLHKKPAVGEKPAFLSEEEGAVTLATSSRWNRAMNALQNNLDTAIPAVTEYFTVFSGELEKFRISSSDADPFDDAAVQSIEAFLPYRNEAIDIFLALALYRDTPEARTAVHRFFEKLIPYMERPQHITEYRNWDCDNFRFIVHELFLYAVACLVRHERFESAAYLMSNEYYVPGRSEYGNGVMVPFEGFRYNMQSLERRNERLELRRLSIRADLLEERCKGVGIEFRDVMGADFILFLRSHLDRPDANRRWSEVDKMVWIGSCHLDRPDANRRWWPETLLYADRDGGPFEVFARSRSARYFDLAKVLLGIESQGDIQHLLDHFADSPGRLPCW